MSTPSSSPPNPMRWILLLVLLAVALGVGMDLQHFAAQPTPITALRTQAIDPAGDDEGSVDAFCGFAPCGMPLECN